MDRLKSRSMVLISLVLICVFISHANRVYAAAAKPGAVEALKMLQEGNERFSQGKSIHPRMDRERLALAGRADQADFAYATVISCSDSRVPVELIFDAGIMELFVVRVAGNVCDTDEIGSIEYGMAHVKTPVLVVLGHTQCGAVTAVTCSLQGEKHRLECNIAPLVENIRPAVRRAMEAHGPVTREEIISYSIEENVWQAVEDLFMKSPVVRSMVREGKALVAGAIYDVGTGKVKWLPAERPMEILERAEKSPGKAVQPFAE